MIPFERVLLPLILDVIEPLDADAFEDARSDTEIFDILEADNDCTPDNAIGLSHCKFCERL